VEPIKRILFFGGMFTILIAILFELGSIGQFGQNYGLQNMPRPGIGIPYLASLDLLMLYTLVLLSLDELGPLRGLLARAQGMVTFILSLLGLLAMIVMIFSALSLIILMVSMFVAVPFGTLAYLLIWGHFATGAAHLLLAFVMLLKLAGTTFLLLSRPLFLKNFGFLLLLATTLLATLLLQILQSWFPTILVSITDAVGALVIGILAATWLIVFLIGSIPAIINSLRSLATKPS
jgi:hypothetical protein